MSAKRSVPAAETPVSERVEFEAELWEWDGPAAWHFLSLPEDLADEIDAEHGQHARGFGSVRVEVGIGSDVWRTSIFPDTKRGTYLLPVKKEIRRRQRLEVGERVTVGLTVLRSA
jgi:Domain of unknown function (DUF1905)